MALNIKYKKQIILQEN